MASIGVAVTDQESLTDMVWANAERFAGSVSFRRRTDDSWLDVTAREFAARVLDVAKGLIGSGVRPGDRVASPDPTGFEWAVGEFAIWTAGAASDPSAPVARPRSGEEVDDAVVHARRLAVRADDRATAEATHRDLLRAVRETITRHPRLFGTGNSMLIDAAPGHGPARVLALCCVYTRTTLGIGSDAGLGTFRPTVVVTTPARLQEVYESAKRRAQAEDRGRAFAVAETVAVAYGRALDGSAPDLALRGKHAVASRFVYPKIRAALGGRCTTVFCAGAAGQRLRHFFRGIGVEVHSI